MSNGHAGCFFLPPGAERMSTMFLFARLNLVVSMVAVGVVDTVFGAVFLPTREERCSMPASYRFSVFCTHSGIFQEKEHPCKYRHAYQ
ncbi:hypothetical protein [Chlorobium limicola]|uniref:hypothetical protein n=1 Tax=Chlorobium limicola TaxID=1092 RepID=UPI00128FBACD|nr:hypothetical protein [Chlorobium limicola]